MKNETIEKLINSLNNEDTTEIIFKRSIGGNVEYAYVWNNVPSIDDAIDDKFEPYTFFLIKNDESKYAAAVLYMGEDLHWFVLPDQRKKALLTTAMQEYIISYLYDLLEDKPIRITIAKGSEFEKESIRVAEILNFKPGQVEGEFLLVMGDVDWTKDKMKEKDGFLSHERMLILRKRFQYHMKSLIMLSQEVESLFGPDDRINENLESLKNHRFWFKDKFDLQS